MSITKKSKHVLIEQSGFTMLEAILAMLMLTVIMTILPLMVQTISAIDRSVSVEDDFEWNLLLIQFRHELQNADQYWIYSNRMFFEKNNQLTYYEEYGGTIRRRVGNKAGHEVVLQKIETVRFSKQNNSLHLVVQFKNNSRDAAKFLLASQEVEVE